MRPFASEANEVHTTGLPLTDCSHGVWASLMPHVPWHSSRQIEVTLALSANGPGDCNWPLRLDTSSDPCDVSTCREVDIKCMNHVLHSRKLTTGLLHAGFSMDKAQVRGLELSNGIGKLPTNKAGIFVPQVASSI